MFVSVISVPAAAIQERQKEIDQVVRESQTTHEEAKGRGEVTTTAEKQEATDIKTAEKHEPREEEVSSRRRRRRSSGSGSVGSSDEGDD